MALLVIYKENDFAEFSKVFFIDQKCVCILHAIFSSLTAWPTEYCTVLLFESR